MGIKILTRSFLIGLAIFIWGLGITDLTIATVAPNNTSFQGIEIKVTDQLQFNVQGGVGSFPALQPVKCLISAHTPIQIQFSASPLSLTDDTYQHSYALDVTYWLNQDKNDKMCFKPEGMPLTLYRDFSKIHTEEFLLYGEIKINRIDDQPAGLYQGTIYVTVSAMN